ncbi:MAG: hypothetical protein KGI58_03880 [Patescibacteria group bacterium]|nr:hypothetical protein [Patescibacteria group bacterium]
MFNIFNRKSEPEKKKPDFQGQQHEHEPYLILFDGTRASTKFDELKSEYKKHYIVKNKAHQRFKSMIMSSADISNHFRTLQNSAISTVQTAKDFEEMIAMRMGFVPAKDPEGFSFCPACIQQSILACEEVLQSLKDIEEATKEYV